MTNTVVNYTCTFTCKVSILVTLENEFLYLSSQYKYISLIGDFNGRTSVEKDYFLFDEKDEANTFSDFIENGVSCLDLLEIPRERKNKDLGKNRHGALLLVFCKGKLILNMTESIP
jgi:hypothetical protein